MTWIVRFATSSVGNKVLMALTGIALLGFVVMHMAGNLLVFAGPEKLNAYAQGLEDLGALLWVARLGLLGAIVVHILLGVRLWMANGEARPERYAYQATMKAPITSRTMIISGGLLATFILYHLAHFTFGLTGAEYYAGEPTYMLDGELVRDVYAMVTIGFKHPAVSGLYIVSMLLLGSHLSHGIQSLFQSLGLAAPKYRPLIKKAGVGLAALLVLGNISMPLAIMLGLIPTNT